MLKGRLPRPLPVLLSFVQRRQRGLAKTNPGRSQHALFRASCTTRCAVTARPFANEQYAFRPRAVWQRVVAVCISRPAIQGNASKKRTTCRFHKGCFAMPRPLPVLLSFVQLRQRGLAKINSGRSKHALFRDSCTTRYAVTARPSLAVTSRPFAINPVECISHFMAKGRGSLPVSCHGNR